MQSALYLLGSCWSALNHIQLFDTGVTVLEFGLGLMIFDVLLLILSWILRSSTFL